jgi:hypothetical protein
MAKSEMRAQPNRSHTNCGGGLAWFLTGESRMQIAATAEALASLSIKLAQSRSASRLALAGSVLALDRQSHDSHDPCAGPLSASCVAALNPAPEREAENRRRRV